VPGYCDMDVVTAPDAAVDGPLDTLVPADPVTLSVQRSGDPGQSPLQAPVAVCPPRPGPSVSDEGVIQADTDDLVVAEEDSGTFQERRLVVPDWTDLETPPVPEVPPLPASPAPAFTDEAVAIPEISLPPLQVQDVLDAQLVDDGLAFKITGSLVDDGLAFQKPLDFWWMMLELLLWYCVCSRNCDILLVFPAN